MKTAHNSGNVKKQSDGYYYEKVVSWKEKPDWMSVIGFSFVFSAGVILLISNIIDKGWIFVGYGLLFLLWMLMILGGIFSLFQFNGKGRKVKFRKIGK